MLENGDVVVGGSHGIVLTNSDQLPKLIKDKEKEIKGGIKAKAVMTTTGNWPNNKIPYIINGGFTTTQIAVIQNAINWWNNNSGIGIKFVPHSGEWEAIRFSYNTVANCSSNVGMIFGNNYSFVHQHINLGFNSSTGQDCFTRGTVLHEMGHAAGLWHEQQRCDRDNYVYVSYPSWDWGAAVNHEKKCGLYLLDAGPYDYSSRMGYVYGDHGTARVYFYGNQINNPPLGRNYSGDWRKPVNVVPYDYVFRRETLSRNDIYALNTKYAHGPNANPSSWSTYGIWDVKSYIWHEVGRVNGDGWSATVGLDTPQRWMVFGPYKKVDEIGPGNCCSATFEIMLDNVTANNDPVVGIDVNYTRPDGTQTSLISRTLRRGDFSAAYQYKTFTLDFERNSMVNSAGVFEGTLEFRVFWVGTSYVRVRNTILKN
jgi:hypothetical protein